MHISVCIISLGRETLYKTLETLFNQKIDTNFEVIVILQGLVDQERIKNINRNNVPFRIHTFAPGLGFGFYRNRAVDHSSGEILAWIDDDEWTKDDRWLHDITDNIRKGYSEVTTSGCCIQLLESYLTNCISLLGYPGGGALGFKKVWKVESNLSTRHLCGGNFAIKKNILVSMPFPEKALYGGEDNALATNLLYKNIPIFYVESATVYHIARDLKGFLIWSKLRKKSFKNAVSSNLYEDKFIRKIYNFIINLFTFDRFLFGKLYVLSLAFFISFK